MPDPNTAPPRKGVLIVDRERLSSIISQMLADLYNTDTAPDGLQAVRKLMSTTPDVLVVEVEVPGNGIKLAEIVGVNPRYRAIPIILTASHPSPDIIIRARNAGADSFLAKPFGPGDLRGRVESLLAQRNAARASTGGEGRGDAASGAAAADPEAGTQESAEGLASDLASRVKRIEGLPSFPATHAEILKLAHSAEASSDDIAEKLQLDSSLLATVFRLVNSAGYGFRRKVDSLKLAVTLLGLEEIANMVMAVQVFDKMGHYTDGAGLDPEGFWRHSVGTAFAARAISRKLQAEAESAFLAGMLHDIGKIVLDRYFQDYYKFVIEQVADGTTLIKDAEKDVLGVTHAEIGGVLATEWMFANTYYNTILYHHHPKDAVRYKRLVCLIHIADALTRQLGFGNGGDSAIPPIDEAALEQFGLADRGAQILTEAVKVELEGAESFLMALKGG